jgi:hypothetical protein
MTTTNEKPNLAMSAEEYAASCGLSLTYVYNCCRRYLISRKAVEAWLQGNKSPEAES